MWGMNDKTLGPFAAEFEATLRDLNTFIREAGVYLVGIILASGGAFIFQNLISVDDWWAYTNNASWQGIGPISMGRPVFSFISRLANNGFPLHPLDTVLLYASMSIFAFAVFHRWSASPWIRLLVVALFVTNPFLVEHLHFSTNQIAMSVALLLLGVWFVSILSVERGAGYGTLLAGSAAAAIALATRQELLFLISGAAFIELARLLLVDAAAFRRRLVPVVFSMLAAIAIAVVVIIASAKLTGLGFVKDGNYGTSGFVGSADDVLMVLGRFFFFWQLFLFSPHYLFPAVVKILVWVIAVSALLQCLFTRDFRRLSVILIVGILLSASPFLFGLLTRNFPYLYAGVYPLALFPCFLACIAMTGPGSRRSLRAIAGVAGSLVILISAANLSAAQVRLSNLNRLDFSTMTQFLAQIRTAEVPDWKIAIFGKLTPRPGDSWATSKEWSWSREKCSVFDCMQELPAILNLTLLEQNSASRAFKLTTAEEDQLRPQLDALAPGSATLVRLDQQRFVILVK